ncbi:Uncharacterized conserved protein [Bordetella avium]|nr:Uncharacterized conserved protein [Bordetella avium]
MAVVLLFAALCPFIRVGSVASVTRTRDRQIPSSFAAQEGPGAGRVSCKVYPARIMEFVLVSACLLGSPVRYNGSHKRADSDVLTRWLAEGRVVSVCPEVAGGMPVPRPPAELLGGGGAQALVGVARVLDARGQDVTAAFRLGAAQALILARRHAVRIAVLKEDSPSCGSARIYDGSFSGRRMPGMGVTAALLQSEGIRVFSEHQLADADACLRQLEQTDAEPN